MSRSPSIAASLSRFLAAALVAVPLLAGCGEEPAGVTGAVPQFGFGAGFLISEMNLSYRRLVGAEALQFTLTIDQPSGRLIKSYGIKTPYEDTVREIRPNVPMAIANGKVYLHLEGFSKTPVAGDYPFELWLVNEHGVASNRIQTSVYVQ